MTVWSALNSLRSCGAKCVRRFLQEGCSLWPCGWLLNGKRRSTILNLTATTRLSGHSAPKTAASPLKPNLTHASTPKRRPWHFWKNANQPHSRFRRWRHNRSNAPQHLPSPQPHCNRRQPANWGCRCHAQCQSHNSCTKPDTSPTCVPIQSTFPTSHWPPATRRLYGNTGKSMPKSGNTQLKPRGPRRRTKPSARPI